MERSGRRRRDAPHGVPHAVRSGQERRAGGCPDHPVRCRLSVRILAVQASLEYRRGQRCCTPTTLGHSRRQVRRCPEPWTPYSSPGCRLQIRLCCWGWLRPGRRPRHRLRHWFLALLAGRSWRPVLGIDAAQENARSWAGKSNPRWSIRRLLRVRAGGTFDLSSNATVGSDRSRTISTGFGVEGDDAHDWRLEVQVLDSRLDEACRLQ